MPISVSGPVGTSVTVTGTGLAGGQVDFSDYPPGKLVDSLQLTVEKPIGGYTALGTAGVDELGIYEFRVAAGGVNLGSVRVAFCRVITQFYH